MVIFDKYITFDRMFFLYIYIYKLGIYPTNKYVILLHIYRVYTYVLHIMYIIIKRGHY